MISKPRIVVSIPAMNDSDLPETLSHLFALSSRKFKISVIVLEQCSNYGQLEPSTLPGFSRWEHEYVYLQYRDGIGAWPARFHIYKHLAHMGMEAEYALTIDAHTRFRAGWDDTLVKLYQSAPTEWLGLEINAPVLTGLMHPELWGPSWNMIPITLYSDWTSGGFLPNLSPRLHGLINPPYAPARHYSACSSFGPYSLFSLLGHHEEKILFSGEEHVMSLEVFREGWGLFHCQMPLSHLSLRPEGRPWEENEEAWHQKDAESYNYLRKVLHADMGSCDNRCAMPRGRICNTELHQILTGLDYRAGKEIDSPWHRWMEANYPGITEPPAP